MYICNFFLYVIKLLPGKYIKLLKEFKALTKKDMSFFLFQIHCTNTTFTTTNILALDNKI